VHYSPDIAPFQLRNPPQFLSYGREQPLGVQVGTGPSAILGSAAVARNRVIAAKASMNRFTVVLLCERIRTVIHCWRQRGFLNLVNFRCVFGIRKFDETEIRYRRF
jgi:hypothetical protein